MERDEADKLPAEGYVGAMIQGTLPSMTRMFAEAQQAGPAVAAQMPELARIRGLGHMLRNRAPRMVVTCARGSSDHAATYAKYMIESRIGIPVSSAALSVASLDAVPLRAGEAVCIAISQSGRSPDMLAAVSALKAGGAFVIAMVNDAASPLAELADETLPLCAGAETSVAATKSYIASLAMIARLVAAWSDDGELDAAIEQLPQQLASAFECDWPGFSERLEAAASLYVLGRGLSLAIAQEAALKLKETSQLHAEAFSTAELYHGPMALVRPGFPVLLFTQNDKAGATIAAVAADLAGRGADVFVVGQEVERTSRLSAIGALPALEPILQVQSFYRAANALALTRGLDPDHPPHLNKVTRTV